MTAHPSTRQSRPDLLVVGHVTEDVTPRGRLLGGTAAYAALTAFRLGYQVAVVTSTGPELDQRQLLSGVQVVNVPASHTTVFENRYQDHKREQVLHQRASFISFLAIPRPWRRAPMVLLGPVAQELKPQMALQFPRSLVAVVPQGWLRRWDEGGQVTPPGQSGQPMSPHSLDLKADIAVVSQEEVPADQVEEWATAFPLLVVTKGDAGVDLYSQGRRTQIPTFPVPAVDPTGAGDVFAAAFLLHYGETQDPLAAGRFANCAASFCVQDWGVEGVPWEAQIQERLGRLVENVP